jgi:hypothetical protein
VRRSWPVRLASALLVLIIVIALIGALTALFAAVAILIGAHF